MRRRKLLWQLYPWYLLITLACLLALTLYASKVFEGFFERHAAANLENSAQLLENQVADLLLSQSAEQLDAICKQLSQEVSTRITVILPDGTTIADSEEDVSKMENHADRPEFIEALKGDTGMSIRLSPTLQKDMMYVAIPVTKGGDVIAVLRTSIPMVLIGEVVGNLTFKIAVAVLAAALLAAAVSFVVSRRMTEPIGEMTRAAERFAGGELASKVPVTGPEEMVTLAEVINTMASELDEKIRAVVQERNELEAVLSSMVEGVLAIDTEQCLISMNHAAGELIEVNPAEVIGRNLEEAIRNTDLQRFVAATLAGQEPVEADIIFHNTGERHFQAHGTVLRDPQGRKIGAVLVLNDVTRLRKLENVRRDFVANVSHEIRTPVTSLKGFVETLLDGAIEKPDDARRFLEIMAKQADRLNAIIEDLLTLSKVEEEAEKTEIARQETAMKSVLQGAIYACQSKAAEKHITFHLVCAEDLTSNVNFRLMEQAVVNLIDNAIKYSQAGSEIEVRAEEAEGEVVVHIRDYGCGIAAEHLPRLFERFYRVDKARSRELGGTGLGLAIVKHIAQAHGGYATVESTPGKGSIFSIHLLPCQAS